MAIDLNPGADQTLVAAAYRAAMANVPKDLSGTYEALAKSYDESMQQVGKMWAEAAKVVGGLASEAISTYSQNKKYDAMAIGIQNDDGVSFLYDELQKTRKGLKDTWFNPVKTDAEGNPLENWRDLNRATRLKLQQDKSKLETQIVSLNEGYNNLATRLENGDFDKNATGSNNWRTINAVGAFKSSSGKTENGDYVKPNRDENGDIFFTLYDKTDKEVKVNGKNVTIKAGDIEKLLTPKNDTLITEANKLFAGVETSGKTNGRTWANDGIIFERNLGRLVENENNLHILMDKELGMFGRSFVNDISNSDLKGGSVTSANIWSMLNGVLPTDSKGNPLDIDISGGTDPKALDAGDFQNVDNYNKLAGAILDKTNDFYNEDVTREVFKDWARVAGEATFKYGEGMRQFQKGGKGSGKGSGKGGAHLLPSGAQVSDATFQRDFTPYINFLNNPTEGQEMQSPVEKYKVKYQGGQFNIFDNEKDKYVPVGNAKETAEYDGLMNYIKTKKKIGDGGNNPFGTKSALQAPEEVITAMDGGYGDDAQANIDAIKPLLEGSGYSIKIGGRDRVTITGHGKTKTFVVDPTSGNDKKRANEIWSWLHKNWKTTKNFG